MTVNTGIAPHWPEIDKVEVKKLNKLTGMERWHVHPKCKVCGGRTWWSETKLKFLHIQPALDKKRFMHA